MLFFFPQVFRKSSKMKVSLAFLLCLLREASSFLRVDLCALLFHYITCPVALPILTIDWTGLRQRYVYMILLIILSPTPHALLLSVHLSHQKLEMELFYFSKICTILQIIGITFSAFSFPGFMSIIWLSSSHHPECSGSLCHSYFD